MHHRTTVNSQESSGQKNFKWNISSQHNFFTKIKFPNEDTTKVSFEVARVLAEQVKPFPSGELIHC